MSNPQVAPLVFHPLKLENDWSSAYTKRVPSYATDLQGIVHLSDAIASTGAPATVASRLPKPARPNEGLFLPAQVSGVTVGDLEITPSGNVTPRAATPGDETSFTELDGVTFFPGKK